MLLGKVLRGMGAQSKALLPTDLGSSWPQRPPHGFLVNMKLEAVDRRTPAFIRVASVEDVEDHRIKVSARLLVLSLSKHCAGLLMPFPTHCWLQWQSVWRLCKHTLWRKAGLVPGSSSGGKPCAAVQL